MHNENFLCASTAQSPTCHVAIYISPALVDSSVFLSINSCSNGDERNDLKISSGDVWGLQNPASRSQYLDAASWSITMSYAIVISLVSGSLSWASLSSSSVVVEEAIAGDRRVPTNRGGGHMVWGRQEPEQERLYLLKITGNRVCCIPRVKEWKHNPWRSLHTMPPSNGSCRTRNVPTWNRRFQHISGHGGLGGDKAVPLRQVHIGCC